MGSALDKAAHTGDGFVSARLEKIFDHCFYEEFNTTLRGGYAEPLYQPAEAGGVPGMIQYRADYFASALHEVAHWCIAGSQRRQLLDYGYWYAPDGRDVQQQEKFEAVEYKPQALEWFFACACGYPFTLSADNLDSVDGTIVDSRPFKMRVWKQAQEWRASDLPPRARCFYRLLCAEFGNEERLSLPSLVLDIKELDR